MTYGFVMRSMSCGFVMQSMTYGFVMRSMSCGEISSAALFRLLLACSIIAPVWHEEPVL
jgi:hypothetical protein